jgi:hypothetical protein
MFVVVVGLFVFSTWLTNHAIETHEGIDPYVRTQQLIEEVGNGNVPPQVLPDARLGAGTAFPRFYPPLPYLGAALLAALTGDVVVGVNASFILAAIASGLTMSWAVRRLGGGRWLAAGAGALYIASPYHVFDANVRGALAEMWAFVWFPLVFLSAWRTIDRRRLDLVLPIAVAGLVLSHTISVFVAAIFVVAIGCTAVVRRSWRPAVLLALGVALGAAMSAWFIVPQQLELGDVRASDRVVMGATDAAMTTERVAIRDLIGDSRDLFRGYARPVRLEAGARCPLFVCGARSLSVGPITLALPIAAAGVFLGRRRVRAHETQPLPFVIALTVGSVLCLGIITYSFLFTALLPDAFDYVQFPWRALAPLAAATTLLWAWLLRDFRRGSAMLVGLGVLAAATLPSVQRNPVDRHDQVDACFTNADVRAPVDAGPQGCFWRDDRYEPAATEGIGNRSQRSAFGFTAQGEFVPDDVSDASNGVPDEPTIDAGGHGEIVEWHRTSDGMRVVVDADDPVTIRIPITAYRFTRVAVDGTSFTRVDRDGLVGVRLPHGATVSVSRGHTTGDLVGWAVSAIALAGLVTIAIRRRVAVAPPEHAKLQP